MKAKENNTQKKTKKLSSKELSWVLYDVGNSAYTLLACALIPIWYKSLAVGDGAGQISSDRATAYYAVAIAVMTVVSALIGFSVSHPSVELAQILPTDNFWTVLS